MSRRMTEDERREFYDSFKAVKVTTPKREIATDDRGNLRVRIIGTHPHQGREGVIQVKDDGVTVTTLFGTEMYEVRFADGDGAFAEQKNLQPIYQEEHRPARPIRRHGKR